MDSNEQNHTEEINFRFVQQNSLFEKHFTHKFTDALKSRIRSEHDFYFPLIGYSCMFSLWSSLIHEYLKIKKTQKC